MTGTTAAPGAAGVGASKRSDPVAVVDGAKISSGVSKDNDHGSNSASSGKKGAAIVEETRRKGRVLYTSSPSLRQELSASTAPYMAALVSGSDSGLRGRSSDTKSQKKRQYKNEDVKNALSSFISSTSKTIHKGAMKLLGGSKKGKKRKATEASSSSSSSSSERKAPSDNHAKRRKNVKGIKEEGPDLFARSLLQINAFSGVDALALLRVNERVLSQLSVSGLVSQLEKIHKMLQKAHDSNENAMKSDAAKVVHIMTYLLKGDIDTLLSLEDQPLAPATKEKEEELGKSTTGLRRRLDVIGAIVSRHVEALREVGSVDTNVMILVAAIQRKCENKKAELEKFIKEQEGRCAAAKVAYEHAASARKSTDDAIANFIRSRSGAKKMTDQEAMSACLDLVLSGDPPEEASSLLRVRKDQSAKEQKAERYYQSTMDRRVLFDFCNRLVAMCTSAVNETAKKACNAAAEYRERMTLTTTNILSKQVLPELGDALLAYSRHQFERMASAQSKLDKFKKELEEMDYLYENEAPSERKSLVTRIREYQGILNRTVAHVGEVIAKQTTFWRSILDLNVLPAPVLVALRDILAELKANPAQFDQGSDGINFAKLAEDVLKGVETNLPEESTADATTRQSPASQGRCARIDDDDASMKTALDGFEVPSSGDVDAREEGTMQTLAMRAARWGRVDVLRSLQSADLNLADAAASTPLILAAWNGHEEAVSYLIQNGVNINAKQVDGHTALAKAAMWGRSGVVQILLDAEADMSICDANNKTAFDLALENGNIECVRSFEKALGITSSESKTGKGTLFSPILVNDDGDDDDVMPDLPQNDSPRSISPAVVTISRERQTCSIS